MMNLLEKLDNFFHPAFKNIQVAKKYRKKALILFIVGGAVVVLAMVLEKLINKLFLLSLLFIVIGTIVGLIGIVKLIVSHNEILRLKRITCKNCGTLFNYPLDVTYELGEITTSSSTDSKTNEISRNTTQSVKVNCICSKCENTSTFYYPSIIKKEKLNSYGAVLSSYEYSADTDIYEYFRVKEDTSAKPEENKNE